MRCVNGQASCCRRFSRRPIGRNRDLLAVRGDGGAPVVPVSRHGNRAARIVPSSSGGGTLTNGTRNLRQGAQNRDQKDATFLLIEAEDRVGRNGCGLLSLPAFARWADGRTSFITVPPTPESSQRKRSRRHDSELRQKAGRSARRRRHENSGTPWHDIENDIDAVVQVSERAPREARRPRSSRYRKRCFDRPDRGFIREKGARQQYAAPLLTQRRRARHGHG